MKVLISHPYSGALYAFFREHLQDPAGRPPGPREPHPYYRTLYGDRFPKYQEVALTLALLFDEIVLAPADNHVPLNDGGDGRSYYNKDLGLHAGWDIDCRDEVRERVRADLEDEQIRRILRRVPEAAQTQILTDARHEIFLADRHSCPIVCAEGRRKIIERIIDRDAHGLEAYDKSSIRMVEEYVSLMGVLFEPNDLQTLVELKRSKGLRSYADAFVTAMAAFRESEDVRRDMLLAMRNAIDTAELCGHVAGAFDGSALVLTAVGLIPVVGTVASVVGLGATAVSKAAARRERSQSWYEFGPQVRRFSSLQVLEQSIDTELEKTPGA